MANIQLKAKPGQFSPVGIGPVFLFAPNAPLVLPGDAWEIIGIGQIPNKDVGVHVPWNTDSSVLKYAATVDASGMLRIDGVANSANTHSIEEGIALSVGVLKTGGYSPFGFTVAELVPATPAVAPVAGLASLVAAVRASWQSHVPVADWNTDCDHTISYLTQPPWSETPYQALVPWGEALNDEKSAAIAALLGGRVAKEAPPQWATQFEVTHPVVNYIYATINGVASRALAADVARAFRGNTPEVTIPAAFRSV